MRDSTLYKILDKMPKGGLHHLHTSAAPSVDCYIKLTYNEAVYFNEREKMFKVAPVSTKSKLFSHLLVLYNQRIYPVTKFEYSLQKGLDEDGYVKCTEMRKFHSTPEAYDTKIKDFIRMTQEECASKESH